MQKDFKIEIFIIHKGVIYKPLVVDGVTLTSHYRGTATQLNFEVIKDKVLNFSEGSHVALKFNDKLMFYGVVFEKSRDKRQIISVKAYDSLRYFQNRDSIEFTSKTADKYVRYIANLHRMTCGELENTQHILSHTIEEGTSYIDMILKALDETKRQTGVEYIFFDDCGKLTLKSVESLKAKCYIGESSLEDFHYTTSIDKDTYTKVKLVKDKPKAEIWSSYPIQEEKDEKSIANWGVLLYYEKLLDETNIKHRAVEMLKMKNRKTVTLTLKNVFGNVDVRAGNSVFVDLELGDMKVYQHLLVTNCTHNFSGGKHLMTLDVKGGVINE